MRTVIIIPTIYPLMNKIHLHKCSVISLNVRGLRDTVKRRSIFTYLKDQDADFNFLQETFSKVSDETVWRNEWGGEIYFSHGTSHSKGVCILINRVVKEKVTFTFSDSDGRIILINLTYNGLKLSFCNIHAPNDHTQQVSSILKLINYSCSQKPINDLHLSQVDES